MQIHINHGIVNLGLAYVSYMAYSAGYNTLGTACAVGVGLSLAISAHVKLVVLLLSACTWLTSLVVAWPVCVFHAVRRWYEGLSDDEQCLFLSRLDSLFLCNFLSRYYILVSGLGDGAEVEDLIFDNAAETDGYTMEGVRLAIRAGHDVNRVHDGKTALDVAMEARNWKMVELLDTHGAQQANDIYAEPTSEDADEPDDNDAEPTPEDADEPDDIQDPSASPVLEPEIEHDMAA